MSNEYNAMNPYATPGQPQQAPLGPAGKNEGKITAIAVIALILGILGILTALMSFAGLATQGWVQSQFANNPQMANDPSFKMQMDMQAVQSKFFWGLVVENVVHVIVAIGLTAGGALALGKKASAYRFLAMACGATVIFEIFRTILAVMLQIETSKAMVSGMKSMQADMQQTGGAAPAEIFQSVMYASIGIGICFTLGFVLAKIGFYIWGMNVLKQEAARLEGI